MVTASTTWWLNLQNKNKIIPCPHPESHPHLLLLHLYHSVQYRWSSGYMQTLLKQTPTPGPEQRSNRGEPGIRSTQSPRRQRSQVPPCVESTTARQGLCGIASSNDHDGLQLRGGRRGRGGEGEGEGGGVKCSITMMSYITRICRPLCKSVCCFGQH